MGWEQQVVVSSVVIIESIAGQATGLFEYSGVPALGNPPQFAVVAPGVTADPFGNAITASKVLVQGNVITESGGVFRTSPTAPLIQLDGPHDAVLVYNASAALVDTIAPVQTTDGLGNTVYPGHVNYGSGAIVQLFSGTLVAGKTAQFVGTGGASAGTFGAGAVAGAWAWLSGLASSSDVAASFTLLSNTANLATGGIAGALLGGLLQAQLADGNTYDTERLTLICAATTINSSTVRVNVFSKHLGVGTYKIHLWIVTQNTTAADAAAWTFNFTGTATGLADFTSKTSGTATVGYAATTTPFGVLGNGQGVAGNQSVECNATLTVTVAGTLTFGGLELVSGNTVTVSAGGQMEIYPVVAT